MQKLATEGEHLLLLVFVAHALSGADNIALPLLPLCMHISYLIYVAVHCDSCP
jgi:hypothetical protein